MISKDLKALDSSPRASLPFSWNSDGDSGIASGGPTGATAFQTHLNSAQSAQSLETGSSPIAVDPQKAETAESVDSPSRGSLSIPSNHPSTRPSIKPIRKPSLNLRAMVDAKVRFIGPSADSISTPSGSSLVPSAQAGPSSWGEPLRQAERLESDTRRPASLNSGFSPRNDIPQGLPDRPLMDLRHLPDAEVVILRDKRGGSQDVPGSKQLSGDVFSAPSNAGLTYASRRVTQRPNPASSSESNSEIKPEFASALEELPAMVSTNSGGGESTSNPQTIAAMSGRVAAVQIPANGSLRAAVTTETFQSLPTSRSATASDPSMGIDLISSEVRDAARRAVAQSQLLGTSQVAVASLRPANNNDAFRSLILDPGTGALPSLTTDLAPSLGGRLSDNDSKQNPSSPLATGLSSVLPTSSTMARTSETNGAEPSANTRPETVQNGVSDPTRVQRNLATTAPTPSIIPVESGSQNGAFIQRETRSVNPSSELIETAPTIEAVGLNAAIQSNLAESPSQPKPAVSPLRPANRSPHARGTETDASTVSAQTSLEADTGFPTLLNSDNGTNDSMQSDTLARDTGSDSSSPADQGHSQAATPPFTATFPGASQAPSLHAHSESGASNTPKTAETATTASLLHDSHKSGDVRLVHLDSPGAGGLELRIQEVGEKLIIRTQDLVGSIDGQSAQWKELQQRLETSGIVLLPIEASFAATAAPIESRSDDLRHTVCYDGNMVSTGRDSSDPRSSSGRARSFGEPSHLASPELPDETTESAEALPASRQWWA